MRGKFIATGASALALGKVSAYARDASDNPGTTVPDTITLTTPLRRESSLERSTSWVTAIEKEEIERSPAVDLPSLLQTFPGVNITSSGGMGAQAGLGLRGATSSHTLLLINGVSVRAATLGLTALQSIPLWAIDRIEIAKGPHSLKWCADAIGDVFNIITKQDTAKCPSGKEICSTVTAGVHYPEGGHTSADVHGATKGGTRFNVGGKGIGTLGYNFTLPTNYNYETVTDGFSCLARCTSRSRRISDGFEPIHPPCIRVHTSSSTPMRLASAPRTRPILQLWRRLGFRVAAFGSLHR